MSGGEYLYRVAILCLLFIVAMPDSKATAVSDGFYAILAFACGMVGIYWWESDERDEPVEPEPTKET